MIKCKVERAILLKGDEELHVDICRQKYFEQNSGAHTAGIYWGH